MNLTIGITLDCVDMEAAAAFWKQATLQRVNEPKTVKNRAHLDLFVDDFDTEIGRLSALGAQTLAQHDDDGGFRTAVLADPVGNEFCVVQR